MSAFPGRNVTLPRTRLPAAILCTLLLTLSACAPLPPQHEYPWRPSPNHDLRRPNFVIIHHTSDSTADVALATLTSPARQVSAHYLIARDGTIMQLVEESERAWHAGKSWWGGNTDLNSSSIGIELDNSGLEPFAEPQLLALFDLLRKIRDRYGIPAANFVGHGDVAPGRKVDPSYLFPWRRLAQYGFGLWCDAPLPAPPPGFDPLLGLLAFGYDIARPDAARQAFRRHFTGFETDGELTGDEQALIYCLVQLKILREPETSAAPGR